MSLSTTLPALPHLTDKEASLEEAMKHVHPSHTSVRARTLTTLSSETVHSATPYSQSPLLLAVGHLAKEPLLNISPHDGAGGATTFRFPTGHCLLSPFCSLLCSAFSNSVSLYFPETRGSPRVDRSFPPLKPLSSSKLRKVSFSLYLHG